MVLLTLTKEGEGSLQMCIGSSLGVDISTPGPTRAQAGADLGGEGSLGSNEPPFLLIR